MSNELRVINYLFPPSPYLLISPSPHPYPKIRLIKDILPS